MYRSNTDNLSPDSLAKVYVKCSIQSDNCDNISLVRYKDLVGSHESVKDYVCESCAKEATKSKDHIFNKDLLENIDNEKKAYILGLLAADDEYPMIFNKKHEEDGVLFTYLNKYIHNDATNISNITIQSLKVRNDINANLYGGYMPDIGDEFKLIFARGYFDANGHIKKYEATNEFNDPQCMLMGNDQLVMSIADFIGIPYVQTIEGVTYTGTNCIDFLGKIYANAGDLQMPSKYHRFMAWIKPENVYIYKTDKNAIIPSKNKASDAGYDVTVISVAKKLTNLTTLYGTGIKINVPHGVYCEIVPRSSLSKSGYMLANSVGIIDQSYTGEIFVALIKVDPSCPDIELPFRCAQLIFRKQVNVEMTEVAEIFAVTSRGAGGFGSST
jgi:deoxyuridine 5'-triphosphate nucleotidohydrolase